MTDHVYVNATRSEVVSESSSGKKWQITRKEAAALGLLPSEDKPVQERRSAFDATKAHTAPQRRRSSPKRK